MKPGALILVTMVDPAAVPAKFRRKRLDWPLHITLVPWFELPDEAAFLEQLRTIIPMEESFQVTVGEEAAFGIENDTPVNLINYSRPLTVMHYFLLTALEAHQATMVSNTNWIRDKYSPHVTHHGNSRLHLGDVVSVNTITVVRLLDDDWCEVVDALTLNEAEQ